MFHKLLTTSSLPHTQFRLRVRKCCRLLSAPMLNQLGRSDRVAICSDNFTVWSTFSMRHKQIWQENALIIY